MGVHTDKPNRRYSIINWMGYQPWKLIQTNIFYVAFVLKSWFLTNITSPSARKTQVFACGSEIHSGKTQFQLPSLFMRLKIICCLLSTVTHKLSPTAFLLLPKYYQATISRLPPTYHYLSLPATTHLKLPATSCLLHTFCLQNASTCHYLPMLPPARIWHCLHLPPVATCHCLPLSPDPFAQIASAENIQQTRMPNNLNRLLLEFRQRISSIWFVFWNLCFWATSPPQNVKKEISVFLGRKGLRKRSVASGPPFPGEDPFATPSGTVNSNRSEPWHRKKKTEFSSC